MSKNIGLKFVAVFAAASLGVGCSSSGTAPSVNTKAPSAVGARIALAKQIRPGVFAGVNDAPRNPGSANFAERQAAAHARGRWLTDELNALQIVSTSSSGTSNPGGSRIGTIRTNATRRTNSLIGNPGCEENCGGSGGGVNGGLPTSVFNDNGGNFGYDSVLDYTDGTSTLFEQFNDGSEGYLTYLSPGGEYIVWDTEMIPAQSPNPQPTVGTCLMSMDGANMVAFPGPCPKIPKWFCPYLGGGLGLVAKWGVAAASKNGQAGDASGLMVGVTVNQLCNAVTYAPPRHRNGLPRVRLAISGNSMARHEHEERSSRGRIAIAVL